MIASTRLLLAREVWQEILVTLLIVGSAWLVSRLFVFVVDHQGKRWTGRTRSLLDDYMVAAIRTPVAGLIVLIGVYAAIHRYQFPFRGVLDGAIFVAGVTLVLVTLIRVLGVGLKWYGERISSEKGAENVAREVLPLVDKTGKVLLLAIGLVVILDHFRIEIRSILVTLGVGSLAIGLALQDTLANMFGGFTIMLDRPFRVGDRIQLSTGEGGDVQAIGIRSTRVVTLEGHLLVIPNAHLVKTMVINQSVPDERGRAVVEVGIDLDADPEQAKALMLEVASAHPLVVAQPPPLAVLRRFGDSVLELVLVCCTTDFRNVVAVRDALQVAILTRFREHGIELSYPGRDLLVRRPPSRA
jgi:small-conductance mechanosensitive channel